MHEFLDFQGEVSLYENGSLKWTKHNKITYQGRAALLKNLAHSLSITKTYGNNYANSIDVNSFICGVAFGRGGTMDGSVLNRNTSYEDTGLYSPVPIRCLSPLEFTTQDDASIERYNNYISYQQDDIPCYIDNLKSNETSITRTDINLKIHNFLYFKKISEISGVNTMKMTDSTDNFNFKSSFVSFMIKIDQEDFKFNGNHAAGDFNSISEMGLYLGSINYDLDKIPQAKRVEYDPRLFCQDGEDMIYRAGSCESKSHSCSKFLNGSKPIMFSHLTFPAEDIIEPKDLTFKYTIFV